MAENSCAVFVNGVRAGRLNFDEVAEDTMVVDSSQGNIKGLVVVNRVPKIDEDSMNVDIDPAKSSECLKQHGVGAGIVVIENYEKKGLIKCQVAVSDQVKESKKQLKRKRVSVDCDVNSLDKETLIAKCRQELDELFEYYKDFSGLKVPFDGGVPFSLNLIVASSLEERNVSFSKLVDEIYEKIKAREGVTLASVRAAVLFVGQRMMYGIANADTDVLEDESESCLWCWETRDPKLLPAYLGGTINIRRTARKTIHERVSALSEALCSLSSLDSSSSCKSIMIRTSTKLGKTLNKEAISSLVENLNWKNCATMADKEAKLKLKEMEKNKRSAEKEKKKLDRELQKEKLQTEKELKRMQDESLREEKRREKEEIELKKQAKKQQEEAAREQQRREKEQVGLKKQLAIQKQASIMERFLKINKNHSTVGNLEKESPFKGSLPEKCPKTEAILGTATTSMDCAFSQPSALGVEDFRRSHLVSWRKSASYNRTCHWGVRHKPKTKLVKELKLQRPSLEIEATPSKESSPYKVKNDGEPIYDKIDDDLEESFLNNDMSCQNNTSHAPTSVHFLSKKLLQFAKSFRPAYYGTWHKKSNVVRPRHPLKKDPELDYEVDSDEEWEEEDPGESLSDCEKDNEESFDDDDMKNKDDDDESEDSFVVPDGYLSENEGVEVEISSVPNEDEAKFSPCANLEDLGEEFQKLLHQQRLLNKLTEKALRKTQPLVISNLNHEKEELLLSEDLSGIAKIEQACLQALCMRICCTDLVIDLPANFGPQYDQKEPCQSTKESIIQAAPASLISDSELPDFVRSIQSCPYGINKVVEVLQQKFPDISKMALRRKVREISTFIDSRWQVNKDILDKLGLHVTPVTDDKASLKDIASYFSKRCLPPARETIIISDSSPDKCCKLKLENNLSDDQCPSRTRPNIV